MLSHFVTSHIPTFVMTTPSLVVAAFLFIAGLPIDYIWVVMVVVNLVVWTMASWLGKALLRGIWDKVFGSFDTKLDIISTRMDTRDTDFASVKTTLDVIVTSVESLTRRMDAQVSVSLGPIVDQPLDNTPQV